MCSFYSPTVFSLRDGKDMKSMTRHIACFCESTFDAQVPESADMAEDPEVEGLIIQGDFGAVSCPGLRETAHAGVSLPAYRGSGGG